MTLCERMSNTCPSKRNCQRHESERGMEFSAASLNSRREAGATACDMYMPIKVVTTFVEAA
jgi:hypothetical protein